MFRFIHSSDLHLGRRFGNLPEPIRGRLIEARHGAIPRLAEVARQHGAQHILLAGDVTLPESYRLRGGRMRQQVTVCVKSAETHSWLSSYAVELGLDQSEVIRLLIEREREVGWLRWSRRVPDPDMGSPRPLKPGKGRRVSRRARF